MNTCMKHSCAFRLNLNPFKKCDVNEESRHVYYSGASTYIFYTMDVGICVTFGSVFNGVSKSD